MSSEKKKQWVQGLKLLIVVICAFFYGVGGTEDMGGKWIRRFLAPGICGAGILFISRDWWSLVKVPLLMLSSSLGYGAEDLWQKIFKRIYVGLAFAVATGSYHILFRLPVFWKFGLAEVSDHLRKQWLIALSACIVIPSVFIIFGVFNPVSARAEETMIGLIIYAFAIMPVEKKE